MQYLLNDIKLSLGASELMEGIEITERAAALMQDDAVFAAEAAVRLVKPAVLYTILKKDRITTDTVYLINETTQEGYSLGVGENADLLDEADLAIVSVYTVGNEVDDVAASLTAKGEMLKAYLLDAAGVALLEKTGSAVNRTVEKEAARRDWGVSPCLSPGSLAGWDTSGQREIAAILDLPRIGVQLNSSGVLIPHKSVSVVIGTGAGYTDRQVGHLCRLCSFADQCRFRRCRTGKAKG